MHLAPAQPPTTLAALMSDDPKRRATIVLQPGRHKRSAAGHPWVYSNEVAMDAAAKALPAGTLVTLRAAGGEPLGVATFNPHTLVSARILARDPSRRIDRGFFAERLEAALALRRRLYDEPFYRLVHAEADGLPGFVIDRFGDVLVAQLNTAGMAQREGELLEACEAVLAPTAMVLRNDSAARALEGLGAEVRVAKGARVLDLYSFTGGFAIAAAMAGADAVLAVDRSEPALALAAQAADMNGVGETCRFQRADIFDTLERLSAENERFDLVIADPPAFVKSKKDLGAGLRGYRKLARLAAALVAPGGLMFTASCSHNVEPAAYAEAVRRGLEDASRSGRILRASGAAADHPVHPWLPESAYLKAELLQLDPIPIAGSTGVTPRSMA